MRNKDIYIEKGICALAQRKVESLLNLKIFQSMISLYVSDYVFFI